MKTKNFIYGRHSFATRLYPSIHIKREILYAISVKCNTITRYTIHDCIVFTYLHEGKSCDEITRSMEERGLNVFT